MKPQIKITIEGLPGSGKSQYASAIEKLVRQMGDYLIPQHCTEKEISRQSEIAIKNDVRSVIVISENMK